MHECGKWPVIYSILYCLNTACLVAGAMADYTPVDGDMEFEGWMLQLNHEVRRSLSEDPPGGVQEEGLAAAEKKSNKRSRKEEGVGDFKSSGGAGSGAVQALRRQTRCPHNRQRSKCRDCGGSSICPHQRQKRECKDCGGSSVCAHSRIRSRCKECGGASICPHKCIRSRCKECGGSELRLHLRRGHECKECGGGSVCAHKRIKSQCMECSAGSICGNKRKRSKCTKCCSPHSPAKGTSSETSSPQGYADRLDTRDFVHMRRVQAY